jgi:hypothetical protein
MALLFLLVANFHLNIILYVHLVLLVSLLLKFNGG